MCRAGLVEVPLGTSLREVVERYGGGVPAGEELKGLHIGGPSGGFLPAAELDLPLSFDALAAAGQILGNGVIIAQGRRTCIADTARDLTRFLAAESCGKCTPCREGLPILAGILERLCAGSGSEGDLEVLDEVSAALAETSLCGF
ncbi:MAG: NADH-quinone oxidoreductase subunit F, partial [Deltaproteobacteria bacterium]|nr:NADH-quinone oxidoreductase subunit F [Deltaproteobacteria bacterium]